MTIKIEEQFEVSPNAVLVRLTGTADELKNLFYTVTDGTGRQLAWSAVCFVKGTDKEGTYKFDVSDDLAPLAPGNYELRVFTADQFDQSKGRPQPNATPAAIPFQLVSGEPPQTTPPPPPRTVQLARAAATPTSDEVLSSVILAETGARRFNLYRAYVDPRVCMQGERFGPNAYENLVKATEDFLSLQVPVVDQRGLLAAYRTEDGRLPYLDQVVQRFPDALSGDPCSDIDPTILQEPFPVELIWSYWQEEGGLVQTLNHILARFQNRRPGPGLDPLARFDLNPLRPLRHLLWSWAEDEVHRLTVRRRAAEYEYEYGLALIGRVVPGTGRYVERRTRFLEAFHTLLHEAHVFFALDDDMTVNADAFPVLNALRDTHLVLAEGAHNQFGDLPTDARIQMLVEQWLLAQPEMRDFLGGRPMVPYEEPWMDRVDSMKSIQGWSSTSITHFHELAVRGEQLLLSIRYGNWNSTTVTGDSAKNWVRAWRNQIQRYVHAYRAVTGVDLVAEIDATMPADLLARRSADQRRRA
ncbi:MAG TPA: hypothetical protein VKP64_02320 [Mycobacteriales bacterium]|nr:hypothetical protein [Mycobacteriales bacterium]